MVVAFVAVTVAVKLAFYRQTEEEMSASNQGRYKNESICEYEGEAEEGDMAM